METPDLGTKPVSADHKASSPSWREVLARLTLCCGLALGLYALVCGGLLTPYINQGSDAGRVVGVFEGYDRIAATADRQRELVLFWGSSMVREGVDCDLVEAQDPAVAAYNLSVSGDLPCRRLVELPRVESLRPARVVIGVSYPEIFETRAPFEDQIAALPGEAYRQMPPEAQALMDDRFREIAGRSACERFWWKRKFLLSAVCWKLGVPDRSNPIPAGFVDNLKAPHVYTKDIAPAELGRFLHQCFGHYPPYTDGGAATPSESVSARSLELLLRRLTAQHTEIVLVNMPLHPLLNAAVPAERRTALRDYLTALAAPNVAILDWQEALGPGCFVDLLHLNAQGRAAFTVRITQHLAERPPQTLSAAARSRWP